MKTAPFLCAFAATLTSMLAAALPPQPAPWANVAISAPESGRYLYRTATGEPFVWAADTNWELFHRLNRSDADLYLADRAAKGFTVVQAVLLSKLNASSIPNPYGYTAIDNGDAYQLDEGYFAHVDWVTQRAAEHGILIAMVPIWGRYVSGGWFGGPILFDEGSMENFGTFLGRRYPGIPMLLGGDTNAFWVRNNSAARAAWMNDTSRDAFELLGPVEDTRYLWAAMLRGLRNTEAETGVPTFATFHVTQPWITGTPVAYAHNMINGSYGKLEMDLVQSGHDRPKPLTLSSLFPGNIGWDSTKNYECIIEMRDQFPGPVLDVENHYEDTHYSFNTTLPKWNASDIRHGLWPAFFSGSAGYTYGSLPVQQSYDRRENYADPTQYLPPQLGLEANASWREGLHLPGAYHTGYLAQLFAGLDKDTFNSLRPDRSFVASPEGSADVLAFDSDRYIAALVSKSTYYVYAGWGDPFNLDLDALAKYWGQDSSTSVFAYWYDPRENLRDPVPGVNILALHGNETFVPPSSGGVDHDWVLILTLED